MDPRRLEDITAPPRTLPATLRYLGPGLIVTGSIVGSGELIATTALGAKAGFTFLWFIIISCVIKTFVQVEIGKYTISSGETALQGFSHLPGPTNWLVWWWPIMMLASFLQLGGIIGGVAQAIDIGIVEVFGTSTGSPGGDHRFWLFPIAISGVVLLITGRYRRVERVTIFLVFLFSLLTVICGFLLQNSEYGIRAEDLEEGFSFRLTEGGLALAFAAFGITGVGATELVYYPYWCLEKGYARFTGPREKSDAWLERARGWVRVLKVDAWLSTVIFTTTTVAFYLLGAAVLHAMGKVPEKTEMVRTLSEMYRGTIGASGMTVFLIGAFCVLYSTFFVATASHARVMTDCVAILGLVRYEDGAHRTRWLKGFVIGFPVIFILAYWFQTDAVLLVVIGGFFQAATLPFIAAAALYLRYRRTDPQLVEFRGLGAPSDTPRRLAWHAAQALLWLAFLGMLAVGLHQLYEKVIKPLSVGS